MSEPGDDRTGDRGEDLAYQREVLENLPLWLRQKNLLQKDIANALGISEGTFSRYMSGQTRMSAGTLRKIAVLLGCHVGDLLRAPHEAGLGALVEETLAEMDRIGPDRWRRVLDAAKEIRSKSEG